MHTDHNYANVHVIVNIQFTPIACSRNLRSRVTSFFLQLSNYGMYLLGFKVKMPFQVFPTKDFVQPPTNYPL